MLVFSSATYTMFGKGRFSPSISPSGWSREYEESKDGRLTLSLKRLTHSRLLLARNSNCNLSGCCSGMKDLLKNPCLSSGVTWGPCTFVDIAR